VPLTDDSAPATASDERPRPHDDGRHRFLGGPRRVAGTIYGTVVVMAVIAAGAREAGKHPSALAVVVAATVLVYWVAHVYAHAIAESVEAGGWLRVSDVRGVASREAAIPLAAIFPIAMLVVGALSIVGERTAVRLALAAGVATLAVEGLRYARLEQLGRLATSLIIACNVVLGLAIVALEVLVTH
jgi:hypothetical protein